MNRVAVHYADGRVLKGTTADFFPAKESFHLTIADMTIGTAPIEVRMKELKALFFVKSLIGDPDYDERKEFDASHPPVGRAIRVVFLDSEVLVGTTTGYQPGRPGFFLVPADPESNNERCYVVSAATREVRFI